MHCLTRAFPACIHKRLAIAFAAHTHDIQCTIIYLDKESLRIQVHINQLFRLKLRLFSYPSVETCVCPEHFLHAHPKDLARAFPACTHKRLGQSISCMHTQKTWPEHFLHAHTKDLARAFPACTHKRLGQSISCMHTQKA